MSLEKKELFKEIFTEDDSGVQKVKDLKDPKEVKAAIEILEEEIDKSSDEGILSGETETETKEKGEETSAEPEKKEEGDESTEKKEGEEQVEGKFQLTDDIISKQPEEDRKILENYKGKDKSELAKAAANAIAMKNDYLKDNTKAIEAITEQLLQKPDDELISTLVKSQRETGKSETEFKTEKEIVKIELPHLPDDPKIKSVLEKETIKRLRKKYPNMPEVDSMESEEFLEWVRDLNSDKPLNKLERDIEQEQESVGTELSKVLYIQENLPNLYDESPAEVIPLLTENNLPKLKALNDNPMGVLKQDITTEVEMMKKGLAKYGLTEKDIEIDLTITEDEQGRPFNPTLNKLVTKGFTADGEPIPDPLIIGERGKVFWLRQGELAKRFKEEFEDKILTAFVNKKTQGDKIQKTKLKEETLVEGRTKKGVGEGKKALTVDDIEKERDPMKIKKLISELE